MAKDVLNQTYKDIDGNMKNFTVIDHDIKPSITPSVKETEGETEARLKWMENYKKETIDEILQLPAVNIAGYLDGLYEDFIIRDQNSNKIKWNEAVVRDALSINDALRYEISLILWRRTVRQEHWFHEIRDDHKAIMRGDWKQLIYNNI